MRNIPLFTTDAGIAGLVLEEIPYKKEAYIRIHSSVAPQQLLEECVGFCRAAGAEHIYATGHGYLAQYPLHTVIVQMKCERSSLPQTDAELIAVQTDSLMQWCEIYNTQMAGVPNSATITAQAAKRLLESKDCYFVYRNETLIGIGKVKEDTVDAVVSVVPGSGRDVMLALCRQITTACVTVEVATANVRATRLYKNMGFVITDEIAKWYCVDGCQ